MFPSPPQAPSPAGDAGTENIPHAQTEHSAPAASLPSSCCPALGQTHQVTASTGFSGPSCLLLLKLLLWFV